jgi:CubicO group peptidase (beta-lactamase class C family)
VNPALRRLLPTVAVIAGLVLAALGAAISLGAASRPTDYRGVIAKLNAEIPRLMKAGGTVGLTIALVDGDHTVWRRGFGWADLARKVPVTANTLFHIGSVSKRCQRRPGCSWCNGG